MSLGSGKVLNTQSSTAIEPKSVPCILPSYLPSSPPRVAWTSWLQKCPCSAGLLLAKHMAIWQGATPLQTRDTHQTHYQRQLRVDIGRCGMHRCVCVVWCVCRVWCVYVCSMCMRIHMGVLMCVNVTTYMPQHVWRPEDILRCFETRCLVH